MDMKFAEQEISHIFTPQPLRVVGVLFSPMVSGWLKGCRGVVFTHGVQMGGWAAGKSLSGLYLRNHKVYEVDAC